MNVLGIVDVAKDGELPRLNLPAEAEVQVQGPLRKISYNGRMAYLWKQWENANRMVFCFAGPLAAAQWLQSRLTDGDNAYRLTRELYLANQAAFTTIGLVPETHNGRQAVRLPHVVCGQSPWIYLED